MKLIITLLLISLCICNKTFLQTNDITLQDVAYSFVSLQNDVSNFKTEIQKISNKIDSDFYQAGIDHERIKTLITEKSKQLSSRHCNFEFFNLGQTDCQNKKACGEKREVNKYSFDKGGCIFFCCNW